LQWCYGLELIEAIRLLKNERVIGVIIGDGSGVDQLKQRCRDYGIRERVRFWRQVPYDELPQRLCLLDVCLSTQTNNLAGRVRTTGKLPLYLAAGRYVLASDVGEAALVLPPEMRIDYIGEKDDYYPVRLARRLSELCSRPEALRREVEITAFAHKHFDYNTLIHKFLNTIDSQSSAAGGRVHLNGSSPKS
jgi:glycosyltransferase involved in cell wall biosynthesis